MHGRHKRFNAKALWLIAGLIALMIAACNDGGDDGAGAASAEGAGSASLYALTTGDETVTDDEVYVAMDGDQARVYQRGSGAGAVFCLGTYAVEKEDGTLTLVLSEESRLQARERLALCLDKVSAKVDGSSDRAALTDIKRADSRLEAIRLFLGSELADEMDIEDALDAFENDAELQAVLDEILSLKQAFFADAETGGNPAAGLLLAKARLGTPLARLMADEVVLEVFYEKEILGSLLSDMDAVDREIALYYACAATVMRREATGMDELDELDEIADELDELEELSVKAAVIEGRYLSFLTEIGYEDEDTAVDVTVSSLWNGILWEGILGDFVDVDTEQYDIKVNVCQPLERLARHCRLAGDAARALRAVAWLARLAARTDDGRIVLKGDAKGWTSPGSDITLRPVKDGTLTDDWRAWEQWADEIDRRI